MLDKIFVFTKAQISSFIGGVVDYLIMIICTEFLGIHYTISIAIGGVIGAIVNFFINKRWTFNTKGYRYKYSVKKQLSAFILVVINSILLKSSGTYYITTYYKIGYGFSRIIMDLIVSVCINYNLQRHLIFKRSVLSLFKKKNFKQQNTIGFLKDLIGTKDFERFSPLFKGKNGNCIAKFAMRLLAIDRVNRLYLSSCEHNGSDFAASLLNELGVNYRIGNGERLHELPTDSFITISNHPYGGLDGIMLIDLMASIRPDYKVMVNEILSMIKPMDTNFISVRPKGNKNIGVSTASVNGIRKALQSIQEGHPIGFFPSGAVSDLSLKEGCVRDREWQMSIIRLIQKAKVPVLPIRFFDKNSWFFYSLGLINWRVRLTRMPYEVFNKSKQNPRIAIGSIIPVETLNKYKDIESLRSFLRKSVYEMPKPTFYTSKQEIIFHNSFEGS